MSDISRRYGNGIYSRYILSSWQRMYDISSCHGNITEYISIMFHFWAVACITSSLYYMQFNNICNLTSEYCGFKKNFFDLSDTVYTSVVYITYNMGKRDLPDIYALARGICLINIYAHALRLGHIYQANSSCSCYNLYTYMPTCLLMGNGIYSRYIPSSWQRESDIFKIYSIVMATGV